MKRLLCEIVFILIISTGNENLLYSIRFRQQRLSLVCSLWAILDNNSKIDQSNYLYHFELLSDLGL